MSALCIDKQMDSHIGLPKWVSLLAHGFILKPRVTVIGQCEGRDDMGRYLHPHIESRILRVYTHMYTANFIDKEIDFHTTKNSTSLSAFGSIFERFLGNRCQ